MDRHTLDVLTLVGFGLILVSFFVRGLGQFVVGRADVIQYAGPISALAASVIILAVAIWTLDRVGVVSLEE
jgi:hypothetical protein